MASNEAKSTPEYGRLKNFWEKKTDTNGVTTVSSPVSHQNGNGSASNNCSPVVKEDNSVRKTPQSKTNGCHNSSSEMSNDVLSASVAEFDQDVIGDHLTEYLKAAQTIGGEVAEHAASVQKAFMAQRNFLITATRFQKPSDAEFQQMLGPTANAITDIQRYREAKRASPFFNHLSGVSESIPALAWVTVSPTPGPHVKEMNDAGQFYTNRVLKDFKDKPGHAEWVKAWVGTLVALQAYIKKNHTTGLTWGKESKGPGGPPPPPPPPAFEMPDMSAFSIEDDGRAQLFAELNKGGDVTKGLKKVSADMQTHKNPNLRSSSAVPSSGKGSSTDAPKSGTVAAKPPKLSLEGKKWSVEHQIGQKDLKIEGVEMNQVIYLFACKDSTLQVKGKLNSIVVDSCVKSAVVFDSVVASIEFVNCRDCQMQIMGTVPTIIVDKVDGLQMFLSKDSLNVEIVSAKSSALNVMVPKSDGEFAEYPVPEQFKTTVGTGGLRTIPTEST